MVSFFFSRKIYMLRSSVRDIMSQNTEWWQDFKELEQDIESIVNP